MSIILPQPGAAGAKRAKTLFFVAFNAVEEADNSISLTASGLADREKFCKKISLQQPLLAATDQSAHAAPLHKRRDLVAHFGRHLCAQHPLRQHFGVG